ncbi:MYCBP-associated protein isoform X2 [Ambystoma mexicanum]|uniref:MYCBP-associated protein isoform X2 n=1 Tax=Ambystoma mexicanum TaxID=8296 RepID=UPI0037E8E6C6
MRKMAGRGTRKRLAVPFQSKIEHCKTGTITWACEDCRWAPCHLGTPANDLLMNMTDGYRQIREERTLIDRCIPAIDYGKGYRAGSEFWNQPMYIGDELTGVTLTLTQQQRGYPEPLVHVQKPPIVQLETGAGYSEKRANVQYSWDKSIYRMRRRRELRPILEELNFTEPEVDGLEVIGRGRPYTSMSVYNRGLCEEEEETVKANKENTDPLDNYPDVIPEIILGPSLQFCGQPARWIGSNCAHREEIGISARVTFEALAGDKASSVLEVANDGTTAIWYEWRRLPHPISLPDICTDRRVQRFYFNTSSGVILPGEKKAFSFLFRSPSAGIFSESWEFCTHPVLLGGASLQLSLFGIALYEDKTSEVRLELQRELEAREAIAIAEAILQELLSGVRSPERPRSPMDGYITEAELFNKQNPQLYYKDQVVRELHQHWKHYVDTLPAEDGGESKSLSIEEIIDSNILPTTEAMLSIPEEDQRESVLSQLNKGIMEMSFPEQETQPELLYHTCLQLWREVIDGLVTHSISLRSILGLPEKESMGEMPHEEAVDPKRIGKGMKDEKKGGAAREERRSIGGREREDKKGTSKLTGKDKSADKEERPGSRKTKGKEEKRGVKITPPSRESKDFSASSDSLDPLALEPKIQQVDPAVQAEYQEKLYTQVYGLLVSLVENLEYFSEGLKKERILKEEEEVELYM